jgi:hypothetical protein
MATRKWEFCLGRSWPVDVQVAGDELDRIKDANGGHLRPEYVLRDASSPDSPLHPCFEWDDSKAAEKYRREQAASLIRSIRVLVVEHDEDEGTTKTPVRAWVRVTPAGTDAGVYLPRAEVASQPYLLNQAINSAISYLRYAEERLAEFRAMRKEASGIKQIRLNLERRLDDQPPA